MSAFAALTFAVNCWIIANKLATALLAEICLLNAAFLLTSSTVISLASRSALYLALEFRITVGTMFGVYGSPSGAGAVGYRPLAGRT